MIEKKIVITLENGEVTLFKKIVEECYLSFINNQLFAYDKQKGDIELLLKKLRSEL